MPIPTEDYISDSWKEGLFSESPIELIATNPLT
jgi:hypothetical protein